MSHQNQKTTRVSQWPPQQPDKTQAPSTGSPPEKPPPSLIRDSAVHAMPSPLLNPSMLLMVSSDQESEASPSNKWSTVPSNKATSDATEVTHMPASTTSSPTVSPPGLTTHTPELPESARPRAVLSRSQATPTSPPTTAMLYKLPLSSNQSPSASMPKPGNSTRPVSSQSAALNSTTAS